MTKVFMFFARPRVQAVTVFIVGVLASIALILAGLAVARISDQAESLAEFSHATVQANIDARYDDCITLEEVKAAGRQSVEADEQAESILFDILPQLDTPKIRAIIAKARARQVDAYEQDDCLAYALEALPEGADPNDYLIPEG